jgi:hypothetical protein
MTEQTKNGDTPVVVVLPWWRRFPVDWFWFGIATLLTLVTIDVGPGAMDCSSGSAHSSDLFNRLGLVTSAAFVIAAVFALVVRRRWPTKIACAVVFAIVGSVCIAIIALAADPCAFY